MQALKRNEPLALALPLTQPLNALYAQERPPAMRLRYILLAIVGIVLFVISQNMAYNDDLEQQRQYCQNVKDGLWPDYNHTYAKECQK